MSEFSRETLLNIIETDHVQCGDASALARMALAAMGSESGCLPLDYLQGHKDGLEWAVQLAEANRPETGDWLYDDPIELAKAIRKGPDMPPAQPVADSEPVAWAWHYREQWHVTNDERRAEFVAKDGDVAVLPLYRHAQSAQISEPVLPLQDKDLQGVIDALEHPAGINAAGKQVVRHALVELQERRKADREPVAEVVSIYGDPEAFGEREIRPLVGIQQMPYGTKLYRHAQPVLVVSADLLHTAASAIEDLLTNKDRTGAGVWFDLPFRLRSAANEQTAPVVDADDNFYSWFGREWAENYQHNQYTTAAKQMLGVMAESAWKAGRRAAMLAAAPQEIKS